MTLSTPAQKLSGSMSVPGKASVLMKSCTTLATRRFPTDTRSVIISLRISLDKSLPAYRPAARLPATGSFQQQVTPCQQRCPQRLSTCGDGLLATHIFGAARRVLDGDWRIPVVAQVIRAGSHVDLACSRSQFQAVEQRLGVDQRAQLVRPFVQIHVRVQATGLLPILLRGAAGRARVAWYGFGGEEAERVEVAASQRPGDLGLDHGVGACGAQPQWDTVVAYLAAAVDHRPFMQSKAVQLRRPPRGRAQQIGHERNGLQPAAQVVIAHGDTRHADDVASAVPVSTDRFAASQHHPIAGMPAAKLPRSQAVVAEQEVPDRMRLADL